MERQLSTLFFVGLFGFSGCTGEIPPSSDRDVPPGLVSLSDVVDVLSAASLDRDHLREVHDAVCSSSANGYDEEYTLADMFRQPGRGVGDNEETKAEARQYDHPLRERFTDYFASLTKAGDGTLDVDDYIRYLESSDMQIYWPNSDRWDGETYPVITFDPLNGEDCNTGWYMDEDGRLSEMTVTEETSLSRPVWVINNNDDSGYVSIDVMRRDNPEWMSGGSLVIGGGTKTAVAAERDDAVKSLVLKDFMMKRSYDNWFQGASEFFIKIGAVEAFSAKVENDIYLYNPSITDFMIVVKRSDTGKRIKLNTLLVSEWTSQLNNCAFMIIEDDGGTETSWNCSAVVKYNSKSYGFEITIPYHSRDDVVWRGQLGRKYIEATEQSSGNFGDVELTFDIIEL